MKKITTLFLFLAVTLSLPACDYKTVKGSGKITMEDRKISAFTSIQSTGSVDIKLSQGESEKITVETDDNIQQYVEINIEDETLFVRLKNGTSVNPSKLVVHVTCKTLTSYSSTGSGDLQTENPLKTNKLNIGQSGSGDIKMAIEATAVNVKKTGSGDFKIKGTVATLDIASTGSGDTDASGLTCADMKIRGTGSGDFQLKKGVSAVVNITGSGEVLYK